MAYKSLLTVACSTEGVLGTVTAAAQIAQAMDALPPSGAVTLELIDRADRDARAFIAQATAVFSH